MDDIEDLARVVGVGGLSVDIEEKDEADRGLRELTVSIQGNKNKISESADKQVR